MTSHTYCKNIHKSYSLQTLLSYNYVGPSEMKFQMITKKETTDLQKTAGKVLTKRTSGRKKKKNEVETDYKHHCTLNL